MDFIYVDYVIVAFLLNTIHNLLDAIFKVTPKLGSCQQCSHIKLINMTSFQSLRNLTFFYQACQSPYKSRFAHSWLSYVKRIVLVTSTEYLYGTFQFLFPAYQWIVLLIMVVHAGYQLPPSRGFPLSRLALTFSIFHALQVIVKFAEIDQLAHEIDLLVVKAVFQQVGSP